MVKILAFDTETTGLPFHFNEEEYPPTQSEGIWESYTDYNARLNNMRKEKDTAKKESKKSFENWAKTIEMWPYIVQLSYILYDTETNDTLVQDMYIHLPEEFTSIDFLKTTHSTTRNAIEAGRDKEKSNMAEAIDQFMTHFRNADVVTGHNAMFDVDMLLTECIRNNKRTEFGELLNTDKIYCTACKATELVQIYWTLPKEDENSKAKPKMPKLNQAYFRMFGYAPRESLLHNALIDVVVCLRVFYRMWFQGIQFDDRGKNVPICGSGAPDLYLHLNNVSPKNPIIELIKTITPIEFDLDHIDSKLRFCEPMENDLVESIMTGIDVKIVKKQNYAKSRHGRYNYLTKDKPYKGGSKRTKTHRNQKSKRVNKSKRVKK